MTHVQGSIGKVFISFSNWFGTFHKCVYLSTGLNTCIYSYNGKLNVILIGDRNRFKPGMLTENLWHAFDSELE